MFGLFKRSKSKAPERSHVPFTAPIAPERPFYAVGDVHGCLQHMHAALEKIDADKRQADVPNAVVVFLGDYVDRGEQSAQVLEELFARVQADPDGMICLKGNHEKMMLDFIEDPKTRGARWIRFGGLQTLASFGVGGITAEPDDAQLTAAAEALVSAMPEGMLDWLRDLPVHWRSGNVHCVHAAMDPEVSVMAQSDRTLLWGSKAFETTPRGDGNWVVHGHTVVDQPRCESGRVSLDTGCYYTGVLSVAAFTGPECRIL